MAFDEVLAGRLREALSGWDGITEQRMFGGLCFLDRGNMIAGTDKNRFMFRVGKERQAECLKRPGARPMDITGRPSGGMVFVDATAVDDTALDQWVKTARAFTQTLPAKAPKKRAR